MANKLQLRRGTAASWTASNPILADGEPGVETDTNKFKLGNGSVAWILLPYAAVTATELTSGLATKASVSNPVPSYATTAAIPATYTGVARVGTDLYVGNGGAAVAVGGDSPHVIRKSHTDIMVGSPIFTVNDKYNMYKPVPAMGIASSEKCMFAFQNLTGLYFSYDGRFWKAADSFSPFSYIGVANPLASDYIACDYGSTYPTIVSMASTSTNTIVSATTPFASKTTTTLPVTTTFYKPVYVSANIALLVPKTVTDTIYLLRITAAANGTNSIVLSTIILPYTSTWQEPTALYYEDGSNTSIALLTDGSHLLKISAANSVTELTGVSGSIINIAATKTTVLVETTTTAFIESYVNIYRSTGALNWKSPIKGYTAYSNYIGNHTVISNSSYFVRIGSTHEDFLNISKDGLQWEFIELFPQGNDQITLREGPFLSEYGFITHPNLGLVLYDFRSGIRTKPVLTGWIAACYGSKLITTGVNIIDIEGNAIPTPMKITTGTASSGLSIALAENCTNHIVTTTGLLASLPITMPPVPYHSQIVTITLMCTVTVFSLTVNAAIAGQTFAISPPTAINTAGTKLSYIYNSADKTWYPC